MTTYQCAKCQGSGYLSVYAGIANGVCFSCVGAGRKQRRPTAKAFDSGVRRSVFRAWDEAAEVAKAAAKADLDGYPNLGSFLNATGSTSFHGYMMSKFQERVSMLDFRA